MLNASFDQIRQYGNTSVAVTIRLLEILTILTAQTGLPINAWQYIARQTMILRGSEKALPEENDREDVRQRYQLLLRALNEFNDEIGSYEVPNGVSLS